MSNFNPNRRAFFQRMVNLPSNDTHSRIVRPPFAQEEDTFLQQCCQCGQCLLACPNNEIILNDGYPLLTSSAHCPGCSLCVQACPTSALDKSQLTIHIDSQCSPQIASYCHGCTDVCPEKAITINSGHQPRIDDARCTQCGLCVEQCDFQAMHFIIRI